MTGHRNANRKSGSNTESEIMIRSIIRKLECLGSERLRMAYIFIMGLS